MDRKEEKQCPRCEVCNKRFTRFQGLKYHSKNNRSCMVQRGLNPTQKNLVVDIHFQGIDEHFEEAFTLEKYYQSFFNAVRPFFMVKKRSSGLFAYKEDGQIKIDNNNEMVKKFIDESKERILRNITRKLGSLSEDEKVQVLKDFSYVLDILTLEKVPIKKLTLEVAKMF